MRIYIFSRRSTLLASFSVLFSMSTPYGSLKSLYNAFLYVVSLLSSSLRRFNLSSITGISPSFIPTTLTAPDGSISATFIPLGATLTHLLVRNRDEKFKDVVLGYDDPEKWLTDPAHPVYNSMVGRFVALQLTRMLHILIKSGLKPQVCESDKRRYVRLG